MGWGRGEQAVLWLRGRRGRGEAAPAEFGSRAAGEGPLGDAEWFGDNSAFGSDRELAAALLRLAGARAPDLVVGPRLPVPNRSLIGLAPEPPSSVAEAFHWLDEILDADGPAELRRRRLRERVRAVIGSGLFSVFQPIVDLRGGDVAGVEALARFERGSAREWFRQAADLGMRELLETAAIEAAVDALPTLPEAIYLSLNISPLTLLRPEAGRLLRAASLSRVVLEVAEAALGLDRAAGVGRLLQPFREAGARLALDHTGSGDASLRQLLLLHPDIIKLDTSVTRGLRGDRTRHALAATLVALAREIGSVVVAEGIETRGELEAVRECGVTHGQGFHLANPAAPPLDLSAVSA